MLQGYGEERYGMAKITYGMSSDEILKEMQHFLGITGEGLALLAKIAPLVSAKGEEIERVFYSRIREEPACAEFLVGTDIESRHAVTAWMNELLAGKYDLDYFAKRVRIGVKHVRIGLPIRYPIAMMEVVRSAVTGVIRENLEGAEALAATELANRLLGLDLAIFNHAYEEAMFERLDQSAGISRELFYSLMRTAV